MKLAIDGKLCSGHGRCYTLAPKVFDSDAEGYNAAVETQIEVPPGEEEAARVGVRMCPERAITIVEE